MAVDGLNSIIIIALLEQILISKVGHCAERLNPLSAGNAFKRIHTVFPQLKFDRN